MNVNLRKHFTNLQSDDAEQKEKNTRVDESCNTDLQQGVVQRLPQKQQRTCFLREN